MPTNTTSKNLEAKLLLIKWRDITSWSGWGDDIVDEGKDEPMLFYTVGFQVKKTKTKLTISDTWPDIGNVTTFPIGCIESLKELKSGLPPVNKKPES